MAGAPLLCEAGGGACAQRCCATRWQTQVDNRNADVLRRAMGESFGTMTVHAQDTHSEGSDERHTHTNTLSHRVGARRCINAARTKWPAEGAGQEATWSSGMPARARGQGRPYIECENFTLHHVSGDLPWRTFSAPPVPHAPQRHTQRFVLISVSGGLSLRQSVSLPNNARLSNNACRQVPRNSACMCRDGQSAATLGASYLAVASLVWFPRNRLQRSPSLRFTRTRSVAAARRIQRQRLFSSAQGGTFVLLLGATCTFKALAALGAAARPRMAFYCWTGWVHAEDPAGVVNGTKYRTVDPATKKPTTSTDPAIDAIIVSMGERAMRWTHRPASALPSSWQSSAHGSLVAAAAERSFARPSCRTSSMWLPSHGVRASGGADWRRRVGQPSWPLIGSACDAMKERGIASEKHRLPHDIASAEFAWANMTRGTHIHVYTHTCTEIMHVCPHKSHKAKTHGLRQPRSIVV